MPTSRVVQLADDLNGVLAVSPGESSDFVFAMAGGSPVVWVSREEVREFAKELLLLTDG